MQEMDENTQTLQLQVSGSDIDLAAIESAITRLGASLHSIDKVVVENEADGE